MKCSFCGKEIEKGKGIMYVKANGQIFYFCSSKCKRNMLKLGRKGKDWKWTEASKAFKASQSKKG